MPVAGDIAKESGLFLVTITAAEAISKGDVVTLASGEVADITAGEIGPFGVAIEDIANGAEGEVAVAPTVIYVTAGTGGVTAFTLVMPSEGAGEQGQVQDVSTPTFDEVVGMMLESVAAAGVGKCRLGYH
jgi:hypothetical protein